jgi:DNA-binding NarL/FixJ family response regulator
MNSRQQVIAHLGQVGLATNREIADATGLTYGTVKYVVQRLVCDCVLASDRKRPEPSYGLRTLTARTLIQQPWNKRFTLLK